MFQYKLYEMFENENTLERLYEIFSKEKVYSFGHDIVGISYDYGTNGYKYVLQKVMDLDMRQYIITPNRFFGMINYCIEHNHFINQISFIDSVANGNDEFVNDYKNKINSSGSKIEKQTLKEKLYSELNWITKDECIDIKLVSARFKSQNTPIYVDVEMYNNGIIFVNSSAVLNQVTEMISSIRQE